MHSKPAFGMRSVAGSSEVTKGNKIFAKTAPNCNFGKSNQSPAEPLFIGFSECFCSERQWGDRRDSNPQQPEPQSGALPLSYDHHFEWRAEEVTRISCGGQLKTFALAKS
jgi:hypothetical protein